MDQRHFLESALEMIGSLTPSLIGSAVAQAWKPALPFRQRFLQWIVGSTVSYYATIAVVAVTGLNGFIAQSIAFAIALLAFDATPPHRQGRDRRAGERAGPLRRPLPAEEGLTHAAVAQFQPGRIHCLRHRQGAADRQHARREGYRRDEDALH